MADILGFLRAAIAPAAEARAGYLAGEEQRRQRERQEALQEQQMARQSYLDQLRADVDASTIRKNNALADRPAKSSYDQVIGEDGTLYLRNRNDPNDVTQPKVNGRPIKVRGMAGSGPRTLQTDQGIVQWNPDTQAWEQTGMKPPPRAGAKATTPIDQTRGALKDFQSQLIRTEHQMSALKSDRRQFAADHPRAARGLDAARTAQDSADVRTLQGYQPQIDSVTARAKRLTQSADSTLNVLNRLRSGEAPEPSAPAAPTAQPGTGARSSAQSAMQQEFDMAAEAYLDAVRRGVPDALERYQRIAAAIARKYGQGG